MKTLLGLVGSLALVACGEEANPLEVVVDTGVVHGVEQGDTYAFMGIRYAAPPVGELRFRPPQSAEPWDGIFDAIEPGSQCPQSFSLAGAGGEEDCLTVNVWTPKGRATALPVMVWMHGGGFVFGSGGEDYYAGTHLSSAHDLVIVTMNYRLGALGFLAHPAFAAEDPAYPSSGNWGLDDQVAALEWVQRNIARFGGDPARVTLFGESAGGFSTCVHYVSPRTEGLFHAAIIESGLCASPFEPTRADAEASGIRTAQSVGCPGTDASAAACLRAKSSEELLAATATPPTAMQPPGGPFYASALYLTTIPNIDGHVIARPLRDAFAQGGYAPRPLIVGANKDEGTLFHSSLFAKDVATDMDYREALMRRFGNRAVDPILARYPTASYPSANAAIAEVTGDAFFVCPARRTARGAADAGAPVYYYNFQRAPANPFMQGLGVFHSAELPFVFGTDPKFPLARAGAEGQPTVDAMQGYWSRLASSGDPNGDGVEWPRFDRAGDRHLVLDNTVTTGTGYKAAACDFWDALTP